MQDDPRPGGTTRRVPMLAGRAAGALPVPA